MTVVILVGHGSKQKGFQAAMEKVARELRRGRKHGRVICAYLGSAAPSLMQAVEECVHDGADSIRVVPYFVLRGIHVTSDIPSLVRSARKKFRGRAQIRLCPYLGYHPALVRVVKDRLR